MIQMQEHASFDDPQASRFFVTQKKPKRVEAAGLTPKLPHRRTQCLEQLKEWHDLMQKGDISKEQYKDLQADILSEVKGIEQSCILKDYCVNTVIQYCLP